MKKITIKVKCDDCRGSGVYSGFCEAPGTAVICNGCDGRGWQKLTFERFTKLRRRKGIHTVSASRGRSIITGAGAAQGTGMTYADFYKLYSRMQPKK